ncbi:hypothetical protein [Nostoc sp.]|uniref:hypothetical protein n=1 Tax=Nostoc sp. TaxID=1180 RepID=UPI002FF9B9DC
MANVNGLTQLTNQEALLEEITEEGELKEVVGGAPGDTFIQIAPLPIVTAITLGPIPAPLGPTLAGLLGSALSTLNLGGAGVEA